MTTEDIIVNKVNFKQPLSLYEWFYVVCAMYELPIRMTMITTCLTLIWMYLLMGFIHNPYGLLIVSFLLAFQLITLMYTFIMWLFVAIPMNVLTLMAYLVFATGWL